MREKLIEMLMRNYGSSVLHWDNENPGTIRMTSIINIADFLIANGAVLPVRCWECSKRKTVECGMNHKSPYYFHSWEDDEDYCSYGERKEE